MYAMMVCALFLCSSLEAVSNAPQTTIYHPPSKDEASKFVGDVIDKGKRIVGCQDSTKIKQELGDLITSSIDPTLLGRLLKKVILERKEKLSSEFYKGNFYKSLAPSLEKRIRFILTTDAKVKLFKNMDAEITKTVPKGGFIHVETTFKSSEQKGKLTWVIVSSESGSLKIYDVILEDGISMIATQCDEIIDLYKKSNGNIDQFKASLVHFPQS